MSGGGFFVPDGEIDIRRDKKNANGTFVKKSKKPISDPKFAVDRDVEKEELCSFISALFVRRVNMYIYKDGLSMFVVRLVDGGVGDFFLASRWSRRADVDR